VVNTKKFHDRQGGGTKFLAKPNACELRKIILVYSRFTDKKEIANCLTITKKFAIEITIVYLKKIYTRVHGQIKFGIISLTGNAIDVLKI